MKLSLLALMTLLGLAMAVPAEADTESTQVSDGTLGIDYCGQRCEEDRDCRRGERCHDCYKRHDETLLTELDSIMAAAASVIRQAVLSGKSASYPESHSQHHSVVTRHLEETLPLLPSRQTIQSNQTHKAQTSEIQLTVIGLNLVIFRG
ncbi:hypothetical protein BO70DRAFT_348716 [Aspergillus heteromorphus CBS 117.55]|uniref:Uncharacterized protein n=1 Tax=Aspergillus heteromorphus CBS 117.55 TaxID=1448321 RepID=A0A317X0X9_9EURO|nr:uncharacterized protein BO70DRAFT_348716 [Aspergillus heteromorphus CBS 117.55]PWY92319.1 hypothetical protein BO70DRAFT_348716 [Aspergillus heteromorphus CBS 117.55]